MVSKPVAWTYLRFALFTTALIVFFIYAGIFTPMGGLGFLAAAVLVLVEIVMLTVLASIHRRRYILMEEELVVKATNPIGGDKRIPLRAIESVERTLMPFWPEAFRRQFSW